MADGHSNLADGHVNLAGGHSNLANRHSNMADGHSQTGRRALSNGQTTMLFGELEKVASCQVQDFSVTRLEDENPHMVEQTARETYSIISTHYSEGLLLLVQVFDHTVPGSTNLVDLVLPQSIPYWRTYESITENHSVPRVFFDYLGIIFCIPQSRSTIQQ